MVVAQKLKEAETVTEQDSLLLTRNLLRIAIFNISYIRGLFPENYFSDKAVPALEMKIKKLMPMDPESRRLIDWMEKGVYDALQKKYLKTLLFCVCESMDGPIIEEYEFSFSYSGFDSQEVAINVSGNKKRGGTFKCNSNAELTYNQMRSSACKMVRTLVQLMRTLDKMPEGRTILMKLLYYEHVTPADYEPPFFRGCTEDETHNPWTKSPLKMEVGHVNSKHFVLALKVKSVLDPCDDNNDEMQEDYSSLGADSDPKDESSESDTEHSDSGDEQYVVARIDKHCHHEDRSISEDNTQNPKEDEKQLGRIKDWICSYHLDTVELADVLSNFPDISVSLTEEIMNQLVNESILSTTGSESYLINKKKTSGYEFDAVKGEIDTGTVPLRKAQLNISEDRMYMKALYHALPMDYITVPKLQSKLEGEANQTTVRKLIDRMTQDGFVEPKAYRRLGKRIIHSDLTEKTLIEIKKALDVDAVEKETIKSLNKSNVLEFQTTEGNHRDMSTCGVLHSIGSDLTRSRGKPDLHQNGSVRSEQTVSEKREHESTPTSRIEHPVASGESFVPGLENDTQEKRSTKASTVKDPIVQQMKRQKSQIS